MRKRKSKNNLKRKYYGILRYSYTDRKLGDVFGLVETDGGCCCSETGTKLFDTKQEAIREAYYHEIPDRLVEFTAKVIKFNK